MHLIHALAAGISGAGGGHAEIYRRGTSTRATHYADFEATAASSGTGSSNDIELDGHGSAVVYVNELVNVRVFDATGQVVREFVAGAGAGGVEVISQSFTGVDYISGQSGASEPVELSTVLDRWKDSAGAVDWRVLVGGVATSLQSAIAVFSGFFVNVRSAEYGAVGDGLVDDTIAIQAAVDAADDAGGGTVFFPAGNYRITASIDVPDGVSLLGAGAAASVITGDSGTWLIALSFDEASTSGAQYIQALGIKFAQNAANLAIAVGNVATNVVLVNCDIGDANTSQGYTSSSSSSIMVAIGTTFSASRADSRSVYSPSAPATIIGCRFVHEGSAVPAAAAHGNPLTSVGSIYDGRGPTSGSWDYLEGVGRISALGNYFFEPSSGATITAISGGTFIEELGNTFESNSGGLVPLSGNAPRRSSYYDANATSSTNNSATVNIDMAGAYSQVTLTRTTNANQTLNFGTPAYRGQRKRFIYVNSSAGTISSATVNGVYDVSGLTNIAPGTLATMFLEAGTHPTDGTVWYCVNYWTGIPVI